MLLEKSGHQIKAVNNGQQVLEELKENSFDLVVMDVQMPIMDGLEAAQEIRLGRAGQRHKGIPIVALTACAMESGKRKIFQAGINSYVEKPIEIEVLKRELERLIDLEQVPCESQRFGLTLKLGNSSPHRSTISLC
jgi:CheY-like chemotaxis protein